MVGVFNIQTEEVEGHMLQRLKVIENQQCEEEKEDCQRSQNRQSYIQAAVELLTREAVGTFGEMLLIVFAHLRINPGYVITPARQDATCDSVCTLGCCHII